MTSDWLGALSQRLEAAAARDPASGAVPDEGARTRREEVRLAHATAQRLSLAEAVEPGHQLVVLGPTQAGKSTLVNRLLDAEVAGVSALAGHTVHAQAFVHPDHEARAAECLPALLEPLRPIPRDELDATVLDTWALQRVAFGAQAIAPPGATVWDTPDFDSIASLSYRVAVTLASALADVIVLVVSKDKYGDQSVWQRLRTLRALGVPLVLVVNKVDTASRATIARALQERLADDAPPVVLLPWVDRPGDEAPLVLPDEVHRALVVALVGARQASADRPARLAALQRFIAERRDDWLAPLRIEQAARERWHDAVHTGARRLMAGYERRWLNGSEHGDAFDRTLVELLTLLEVPGLARVLQRTRQAVTWPARKLLGLGLGGASRLVRGAGSRLGIGQDAAVDDTPAARERRVLDELLDTTLIELREHLLDERAGADQQGFWARLDSALTAERPGLQQAWSERASALHAEFQPRIDATARQLHERLQAQPALLNTLRATRLGTDAAGVALAVKSGGMAPADLILAPAMLSVTTLLTESALGRYLDGVRRDLEQAQKEAVRQALVNRLLVPVLHSLAADDTGRQGAQASLSDEAEDPMADHAATEVTEASLAALHREVSASSERIARAASDTMTGPAPG